MSIQSELRDEAEIMWHWTAAAKNQEQKFRAFLDELRPTRIVEIGTHQGVSAALLAEYAPVTTMAIWPDKVGQRVWRKRRRRRAITELVFRSSRARDEAIAAAVAEADLAFVDGCHLMPDVVRDFDLTIPCGRVILHDYWHSDESWPDVREFVDALDRTKYSVRTVVPFALVVAR